MILAREILERTERANEALLRDKPFNWDDPERDAVELGQLVRQLVEEIHLQNRLRSDPRDLCLVCGYFTWGRPAKLTSAETDMTRRQCNTCGVIRTNPSDEMVAAGR